ncbi:PH domain-containing protein [Gracilimonas mengyeensis]|uniref:Putative membrane protein n=1 Tax=Gracilimonas mengyeensis TaxID=1302730 RepID=A0A521B9P9_9BACT|nr:PH domain-containing protein [Gracilimonas mengyeensis]SMO43793.1 putative membrane protein [Gracilimonas mengyeensis]
MSEFKRQHPIAAVSRVLSLIRENLITIIILLFIGTSRTQGYFIYFLLGGLAIALIGGVFGWWVFKYRVYEEELQIKKGIFVKNQLYLSKDRIQVIDITEGILQRMFGLVKVEVKTAGGGTETATISAITREEAEALRTELRKRKNGKEQELQEESEAVAQNQEEEVEVLDSWKLSTRDLVFAAFTSSNFGVIASILGAVSGQLDEFINEETVRYVYDMAPGYSNVTVIVGLVVAIIVISWLLSFLGVIFKYSDFRLQKTKKELIITSGLLERKHITVPFNRIQAVRYVEGVIRQPLGYGMLYVESAGFNQSDKGRSIVLVPYLAASRITEFLGDFLDDYSMPELNVTPPKRAKWRYIRRINYAMLVIVPLLWWLLDYGWLSILAVPILSWLGWLRYRDAAYGVSEELIHLRYRTISRTTAVVKRRRVQNVELSENPFQKNKQLNTLKVTVASGAGGMGFEIEDLDSGQAHQVLQWLMEGKATLTSADTEIEEGVPQQD